MIGPLEYAVLPYHIFPTHVAQKKLKFNLHSNINKHSNLICECNKCQNFDMEGQYNKFCDQFFR